MPLLSLQILHTPLHALTCFLLRKTFYMPNKSLICKACIHGKGLGRSHALQIEDLLGMGRHGYKSKIC